MTGAGTLPPASSNPARRVKIVAYYAHISRTGRTCRGLIRRELQDAATGEVLRTGKYTAPLRKHAERSGFLLERPNRSGETNQ